MLRLAAKSPCVFQISRKAITSFRSFSSSSSSSSSTRPPSPWLMLPPSAEDEGGRGYNFYSPADNKVLSFNINNSRRTIIGSSEKTYPDMDESEFVGSSHGWISLFNRRSTDMFLFNPLTGRHIKLPPMDTIYTPPDKYNNAWVDKLIITCPPGSERCRAVMQYNKNKLAYCTPGSSTRWTGPINPPQCTERRVGWWGVYDDFVYATKLNLLLCIGDGFEAWKITDDQFHPKRQLIFENRHLLYEYRESTYYSNDDYSFSKYKHLVEYDGQIFLLIREVMFLEPLELDDDFPYKTVAFHVHKIEIDRGILGESEGSLDGLAMFVGRNHSFALRADDYPGLKPNSVYFTEHWSLTDPRTPVDSAYGGHDIGVFDYERKTISPCYYPCHMHSFKRIMPAPMWFTPTPAAAYKTY